ncbi:MAG: nucleoside deaminase [Candidatus Aureabacteria bacterium]|nr:nucleoside deaminase [Candidatus Auribacterota bacterium]NLW93360.1 nucleoside deaminase [Chlamydiota bacterium]
MITGARCRVPASRDGASTQPCAPGPASGSAEILPPMTHADAERDLGYMREALKEAAQAFEEDEVPVGAVIVRGGRVVARAHNQVELLRDATAHAEMIALTQASSEAGDWRLDGAALYVTKEPCPMCAGAIALSRVARLVFGARDPKAGAAGSRMDILGSGCLNHTVEVEAGVEEGECGALLKAFFKKQRAAAT